MTELTQDRPPNIAWPLGPIAHRGLHDSSAGRIENTASAIEAALTKGYAIEVDLQSAQDGFPVVFHDEGLDRLVEAHGLIAERSTAQLKGLTYRGTTDRILTIDELLELIGGRVPLYVEIKTLFAAPGLFEERIAKRLTTYSGPIAMMSFDPRSMGAMRRLAPSTPRGLISYRWDDDWMPQIPKAERIKLRDLVYHAEVGASFIAYDIDDLPEPAPLALKAQPGVKLLAWTVRTTEQRDRACRYADAIIFEGFEP